MPDVHYGTTGLTVRLVSWTDVLAVISAIILGVALIKRLVSLVFASSINTFDSNYHRIVLITGCDHGLGAEIVKQALLAGYTVVASCRTDAGRLHLNEQNSLSRTARQLLHTITIDVTNQSQIDQAVVKIRELIQLTRQAAPVAASHPPIGLYALVNNAAIAENFLVEFNNVATCERSFNVNTLGAIRMVKAFAPLLRSYNVAGNRLSNPPARIINVTSFLAAVPTFSLSAYCITKSALSAFTTILRQEMHPFGIAVSEVMPGTMQTPMMDGSASAMSRIFNDPSNEHLRLTVYGVAYSRVIDVSQRLMQLLASQPQHCADVIVKKALHSLCPARRYVVGADSKLLVYSSYVTPQWLVDLSISAFIRPPVPLQIQQMKSKTEA